MSLRTTSAASLSWLILVVSSPTLRAQEESRAAASLGDTAWALPGIVRVGVPGGPARPVALAGFAGYGYTEPQTSSDGAHHRLAGSAAVGVAPVQGLELALRFDGRYDHHSDAGGYGSAVGDPRFLARYGAAVGGGFRLGGEAVVWLPGQQAPSVAFDATTLDAKFLGAWQSPSGPTVAATVGFRWDHSAHAAPDLARLRYGDLLALGLSDFDALLAGLGASFPIDRTELLGEVSADALLGSGSPGIAESPIRITAGARYRLLDSLALQGLAEVSPSGRPAVAADRPLVPIEPRFSVTVGLVYRFVSGEAPAPAEAPSAPPPPETTTPALATLVVRVVGDSGQPVPDASVQVEAADGSRAAEASGDGSYRLEGVPEGDAKVTVTASGFVKAEQTVHVAPPSAGPVEIRLAAAPPSGQLRGLIRSFAGKGIAATVRVDPLGAQVKADAQGAFTLDVPPGDYEVTIRAPGFADQRRKVHVDRNGVTVVNAELFESK